MNITLGRNAERDTVVVTVEITNTMLYRERKLQQLMHQQKPDALLHEMADLAFRMQKGMVK